MIQQDPNLLVSILSRHYNMSIRQVMDLTDYQILLLFKELTQPKNEDRQQDNSD